MNVDWRFMSKQCLLACLIIAADVIAFPARAVGQVVPDECNRITNRSSDDYVAQPWSRADDEWLERLIERVRYLVGANTSPLDEAPAHSIDDLWHEDSAAVELGLARMIGDQDLTTRVEARVASELYRSYSGRPGPLLYGLAKALDDVRRHEGLLAIKRGPMTPWETQTVLRFGCDAGWLLQVLRSDTGYWNGIFNAAWGTRMEETLLAAYKVLDDQSRLLLAPVVVRAIPDNGEARLEWINDKDSD